MVEESEVVRGSGAIRPAMPSATPRRPAAQARLWATRFWSVGRLGRQAGTTTPAAYHVSRAMTSTLITVQTHNVEHRNDSSSVTTSCSRNTKERTKNILIARVYYFVATP